MTKTVCKLFFFLASRVLLLMDISSHWTPPGVKNTPRKRDNLLLQLPTRSGNTPASCVRIKPNNDTSSHTFTWEDSSCFSKHLTDEDESNTEITQTVIIRTCCCDVFVSDLRQTFTLVNLIRLLFVRMFLCHQMRRFPGLWEFFSCEKLTAFKWRFCVCI